MTKMSKGAEQQRRTTLLLLVLRDNRPSGGFSARNENKYKNFRSKRTLVKAHAASGKSLPNYPLKMEVASMEKSDLNLHNDDLRSSLTSQPCTKANSNQWSDWR